MEIATLICSIIAVIIASVCLVVLIIKLKNKGQMPIDDEKILSMTDSLQDNILETTTEAIENARKSIIENTQTMSSVLTQAIKPYMDTFNNNLVELKNDNTKSMTQLRTEVSANIESMKKDITNAIETLKTSNSNSMKEIQQSNEKKLEEMRATVNEKLDSTLNERINGAFKVVIESLNNVQKGFAEMSKLTDSVSNLNKAFTNVKTRGTWGEVSLESLLDQILTPDQYKKQFRISHTKEMVDFAIRMPGQDGEELYLPIDAKFPIEDYERLVDASEKGMVELVNSAKKDLVNRIKGEAKSIRDKYINPPYSTNFAIIYLPTEALYAEVAKTPGLLDLLRNDYQVTACGPTTIAALLNSLQMGFTTLTIQKKSKEIQTAFVKFRKDFKTFSDDISRVRRNAEDILKSVDKVDKRKDIILKNLNKFGDTDDNVIESHMNEEIEGTSFLEGDQGE